MQLKDAISHVLPKDRQYDVLHWQSTSRDTHPLVTQKKGSTSDQIKTIKCEHFITLAHDECIFFGLEIFVYITIDYKRQRTEKLLFVSKADTTGHNSTKVKIGLVTSEIIKYLLQIPLKAYLASIIPKEATQTTYDKSTISRYTSTKEALGILLKRHTGQWHKPETVKPYSITDYPTPVHSRIALFTRSEPQYLFPESSKVPTKHVLSGEGLLKWWLKAIDPIIHEIYESHTAFLRIPAEEDKVIQRYLAPLESNWGIGDMFTQGTDKDIAVFKVPLFPDDPKARFLEHLVVENRATSVTVKQFWEELQMRQEFRLGVTVSVIGVDGVLKHDEEIRESGIVLSHKKFKQLKNYITGDDYSDEEGGAEAYKNVMNYLESIVGDVPVSVTGQYIPPAPKPVSINTIDPKRTAVNNLSTLVRKKQKK